MMQTLLMLVIAQTPTAEQAKSWTDWLQQAGGWGVATVEFAVLVVVCRWFIKALEKKDDKLIAVLEKQNETYKVVKGGT